MFRRRKGKTKYMWLPVTTSTAFTSGAMVSFSSGLLIPATSTTTAASNFGIIRHTIASTDSDYATARLVEVEVPVENAVVWEADTSSAVAADIGNFADLTDSLTVNRGASAIKTVFIVEFISATKLGVVLNCGVLGMGTT